MKYLRQENNRFIFEDGGKELELFKYPDSFCYEFGQIEIKKDLSVSTFGFEKYKEIQTAVQMMTILKDKGLV